MTSGDGAENIRNIETAKELDLVEEKEWTEISKFKVTQMTRLNALPATVGSSNHSPHTTSVVTQTLLTPPAFLPPGFFQLPPTHYQLLSLSVCFTSIFSKREG